MKATTTWKSNYFFGNEVSDYGKEYGYIDYRTLAKAFDAVLNNNIMQATGWENWEQENGYIDNSEEIEEIENEIEELENEITDESTDEQDEEIMQEIDDLRDRIEELEEEQDEQPEIFQYFIISGQGAQILEDYTNEIIFYNEALDMYVWGVTHCGTSWDYVLTDIKIERGEN